MNGFQIVFNQNLTSCLKLISFIFYAKLHAITQCPIATQQYVNTPMVFVMTSSVPVFNNQTDIRLPNRQITFNRKRGAEMKWFVMTIRSSWRSFRGVEIFIEPPRFLWYCQPVPRLHYKIFLMLETPPASWLLLAENCHMPTIWQFAAVFSLANFVAWSPLTVQRNIKSLYRNPMLHKST